MLLLCPPYSHLLHSGKGSAKTGTYFFTATKARLLSLAKLSVLAVQTLTRYLNADGLLDVLACTLPLIFILIVWAPEVNIVVIVDTPARHRATGPIATFHLARRLGTIVSA